MNKQDWKTYFGELRAKANDILENSRDIHLWDLATKEPEILAKRENFRPTYGYVWINFDNAITFYERKMRNRMRHAVGLF